MVLNLLQLFVGGMLMLLTTCNIVDNFHMQEFAGQGPIKLSDSALANWEKYNEQPDPGLFAVTLNGTYSIFTSCEDTDCNGQDPGSQLLRCIEKFRQPCGMYADRGKIVWKPNGPLMAATAPIPVKTTTDLRNYEYGLITYVRVEAMQLSWTGHPSDLTVQIAFVDRWQGKFVLHSDMTGLCTGLARTPHSPSPARLIEGGEEFAGEWYLNCAKGQKANGSLLIQADKHHEITGFSGQGTDKSGNHIQFNRVQSIS